MTDEELQALSPDELLALFQEAQAAGDDDLMARISAVVDGSAPLQEPQPGDPDPVDGVGPQEPEPSEPQPVDPQDPAKPGGIGGGGGGGGGDDFTTNNGPTGQTLNGAPGTPQIWQTGSGDDATYYLVYFVPPTAGVNDFFIPLLWEVPTQEDLDALLGVDEEGNPVQVVPDRTFASLEELESRRGGLVFGTTNELANFSQDPFLTWVEDYETQANVRPWMRNKEVMRLIAGAMLEGRAVTEAELQQTRWYQSRNDAERAWAVLYESDPATARQIIEDNRIAAVARMENAGLSGVPDHLVNWMADQFTTGRWSETMLAQQVRLVSDPFAQGTMDERLAKRLQGIAERGNFTIGTTNAEEETVRSLVADWLGPMFGNWSDNEIKRWAGTLRNQADGREELINTLRGQRLALLPEYADPNLRYEDIAAPWRNFFMQEWGQAPDETEGLFHRVLRLNDATESRKLLLRRGIRDGVAGVRDDVVRDMFRTFGEGVRSPL